MARTDLTTYEVWLNEAGSEPVLAFAFQDEVGLSDSEVYTNAVARLEALAAKIETPGSDTRSVRVGVIHPPGVSVRRQRFQDDTE